VFYVKDVFGMKVENESKIQQIRNALNQALGVADEFSVRRSSQTSSPVDGKSSIQTAAAE
tara:strand:+ start:4536 stop:4715 length:180 start_codon:yes stop_codon:yes gene_type:complete